MIVWLSTLLLTVLHGIRALQYLSGDFLLNPDFKGPDGSSYQRKLVDDVLEKDLPRFRRTRAMRFLDDPLTVREKLMASYEAISKNRQKRSYDGDGREIEGDGSRHNYLFPPDIDATIVTASAGNSSRNKVVSNAKEDPGCSSQGTPQRLCKTRFNTTAPMYGVSLTSGKPVTIVQKFPDLLQQVIFEICTSENCDVVHGECIQTFTPYLFLVIPLGPVTLTGQDYVLVESGCVCRPKYAKNKLPPNPLDVDNL